MNVFDLIIVAIAVAAGIGGYRLGFLARALSWIGLGSGLYVGARFVPRVVTTLNLSSADARLAAAIVVLLAAAFVGQALGLLVGGRLHAVLPFGPLRTIDRVIGAAVGAFGVFVALWLLLPAISSVPGYPARAARGSAIARFVSTLHGPPHTLEALRRLVGGSEFSDVFNALGDRVDAGPPPANSALSTAITTAVAASTVQVQGQACDRIQDGSGFTIGTDLVVTNAHVVAGEPAGQTSVIEPSGKQLAATVVRFDPDRDLALLSVPGLGEPPLVLTTAGVGTLGAVFGHPGGQPALAVTPARVSSEITAVGQNLYDTHSTSRDVFVLASNLAPGDSGGALVTTSGRVAGVAFAIDPDQPGTSYALTYRVLQAFLAAPVTTTAVSTQSCLTS